MFVNAFQLLDKIIFGRFLRHPTTEQIKEMLDGAREKSEDHVYKIIDEATGDLDSKTAALLTHISILVAGLLVMYSSKAGLFKFIILIELCSYLVLAILCLRTIRFTWTYARVRETSAEPNSVFAEELYKRGELYNITASATIFVTLAMLVTLIVDGVL